MVQSILVDVQFIIGKKKDLGERTVETELLRALPCRYPINICSPVLLCPVIQECLGCSLDHHGTMEGT